MNVRFHPEAIAELEQTVAYYEDKEPGLGLEFAEEVTAAIKRIQEYPEAWDEFSRRTRRCLLHRFPYGVIYYLTADTAHIVAIAHLHRKPGYWRKRR